MILYKDLSVFDQLIFSLFMERAQKLNKFHKMSNNPIRRQKYQPKPKYGLHKLTGCKEVPMRGKFDNAVRHFRADEIAAPVGLGIEVVFYPSFVFLLSDSTQIIYDYFYERGWVPYVLTYLACWSFAILFFKHRKLKSQQNDAI